MKRLALLITLGVFWSSGLLAQNFYVSGGTSYSVALCASGNVITWGNNAQGQLARKTTKTTTITNSDGSSTVAYDDVPKSVTLTDPKTGSNIVILAVDAGSGGHAVALGCDSTAWTWGGNEHGQLGNGYANYGSYTAQCTDLTSIDWTGTQNTICNKGVPQHVVAGETAGKTGFSGTAGNPYSGVLKNVTYITASTSGTFAIVKDPVTKKTNLLAWGSNKNYKAYCDATGQLGIGSTTPEGSAYPRYVLDKAGKPLTNVIAVDAGDNNCFAIIDDDNDGDPTTGTVYGWGDGTSNKLNPTATTNQLYALPVYTDATATKPLKNIKMISAGDGFLLAYDATGYLWSVGSEWCASGSALSTRANGKAAWTNPKEAAKVVSGEEALYNGGDSYMSAVKGISAGQASGMAMVELTIGGKRSNYILGWGSAYGSEDKPSGTACANDLANKTANGTLDPTFAYRTNWRTGVVERIDSVVGISDGDGVMYAIRLEKNAAGQEVRQLYVTGTNGAGQLGFSVASNKGLCVFTKLDLPSCDMGAPCAVADLQPFLLCPAEEKEAFAGSEGVVTYHYVWQYYDSTGSNTSDGLPGWAENYEINQSNTASSNNTSWTFDAGYGDASRMKIGFAGWWKVSIYDTRPKLGCTTCPVVSDSALIQYSKTPIDTTPGEYCGTATNPYTFKYVETAYKATTVSKRFVVYGGDATTKQLAVLTNANFTGTSTSTTLASLKTSDLEQVDANTYRMWIADSTTIQDDILSSTKAPITPLASNDLNVSNTAPGWSPYMEVFTAYSDFVLKSVTINLKSYNATGSVVATPIIYKAVKTTTGYKPGAVVYQGTGQTIAITGTESPYVVNVGGLVTGSLDGRSVYIFGIGVSGSSFNANGAKVTIPVAGVSNSSGGILTIWAAPRQESDGSLRMPDQYTTPQTAAVPYNWVLQKTTSYTCGRIPIRFKKNCPPCKDPFREKTGETFTITVTGADTKGNACPGNAITLTTNAVGADYADSVVSFQWYNGDPKTSTTIAKPWTTVKTGVKAGTYSFTAGTTEVSNDWYVVARHAAFSNDQSCYDTAHVVIKEHTAPTFVLGGGGAFCKGKTSPDITVQLYTKAADTVGKTPWNLTYSFAGGATKYIKGIDKKNIYTISNPGAGKFVLDSISDKYCMTRGAAKDTVLNTEVKYLDSLWAASSVFKSCSNVSSPAITVNTVTPANYTWYYKKNGVATFTKLSNTTSSLASPDAGQYYVEFTNTVTYKDATGASQSLSCVSKTKTDTVVRYPLPQFTLKNGKTYCSGDTKTEIEISIDSDTILKSKYGAWTVTPSIDNAAKTAVAIASATALTTAKANIGSAAGKYTVSVKNDVTGCVNTGDNKDTANIIEQDAIAITMAKPANFCSGSPTADLDMKTLVSSTAPTATFNAGVLTYAVMSKGVVPTAADYKSSSLFTKRTVTTAGTDDTYDLYVKWQKTGEKCPAIDSTQITIYANPVAKASVGRLNICLSDTTLLKSSSTGSHIGSLSKYEWACRPVADGNISGSTTATAQLTSKSTYSGSLPKVVTINMKVTDDNSCVDSVKVTTTVNGNPTVNITNTDTAFCVYEKTATFAATATPTGGTGKWSSTPAGAIDGTTGVFSFTAAGNTTITYDYTDMYGCKNNHSTIAIVNPAPTVAISNTDTTFCAYEAAVPITFSPSTATGGVFKTATGLTNGSFIPKDATPSANTLIEYTYTDATTNCSTVVKKTFIAYPKPDAKFTTSLPDTICLDGGAFDLKPYVSPAYPTTGALTQTIRVAGLDATSVDPKSVTSPVTVSYLYEDAHTCKDTATESIVVFKPTKPADYDTAVLINTVTSIPVKASGIDPKATYKWFDGKTEITSFANKSLVVSSSLMGATGFTAETVKVFKLVQYISGCVSDSATITITVFDCPYTLPPTQNNVTSCYANAMSAADLKVSAIATNAPATPVIHWFTANKAVKGTEVVGTDYSFTQAAVDAAYNGTDPVKLTMYAFEYNTTEGCYGPGIGVTLTVNPKPVINVTVTDMCWKDAPKAIDMGVPGDLTINGTKQSTVSINPNDWKDVTKASNAASLTFEFTNSTTGCKADAVTKTINIKYVAAPTVADKTYSVSALSSTAPTGSNLIAVQGVGATSTSWFEQLTNNKLVNSVATGTTFDTKQTTVNDPDGKSYYVRSDDGAGCVSDSVQAKVIVIKCPTPAPVFVHDTLHACAGKDAKTAASFEIVNAGNQYSGFKWYDSESGTATFASSDGLQTYKFPSTATVTAWVSQRGDDGSPAHNTCEGPRKKITFQVNPMPVVSLSVPADLCLTKGNSFELTGSATVGGVADNAGTGYYTHKNTAVAFEKLGSNKLNVSYSSDTVGKPTTAYSDDVTYVHTTKYFCTDSITKTVASHHVAQPVLKDVSIMRRDISGTVILKAVSKDVATSVVKWSPNSTMSPSTDELAGYDTKLSSSSSIGPTQFFATQNVQYGTETCASMPRKTIVTLFDCPVQKPTVVTDITQICVYDNLPTSWVATTGGRSAGFDAGKPVGSGSNPADSSVFRLYSVDPSVDPASTKFTQSLSQAFDEIANGAVNGKLLLPLTKVNGEYKSATLYLVEYDKKYTCFGPAQKIDFTVNKRLSPASVTSQPVCAEVAVRENKGPVITVSDRASDKMLVYKSVTAPARSTTPDATVLANTYTTNELVAGTSSYWVAYDNGCISDPVKVDVVVKATPAVPTVDPSKTFSSCQYQSLVDMSVTSTATVLWYKTQTKAVADELGTAPDFSGKSTYTPSASTANTAGSVFFYVRAKSTDGCVSEPVAVEYIVKPEPGKVTISGSSAICSYWATPTLNLNLDPAFDASRDAVYRVKGVTHTSIGSGTSYKVLASEISAGANTFTFTQKVDGCESQSATHNLYVVGQPSAPATGSTIDCYGQNPYKTLTIKGATKNTYWFDNDLDTLKANALTSGDSYTPAANSFSRAGDKFYYLRQFVSSQGIECVSNYVDVMYTTIDQPAAPTLSALQYRYCGMNSLGTVTAKSNSEYPGYFTWMVNDVEVPNYSGDNLQLGSSYLKLNKNSVKAKFTTSGTGCPSAYANQDIWIHPVPATPTIPNIDSVTIPVAGQRVNINQLRYCESEDPILKAYGIVGNMDWRIYEVANVDSILYNDVLDAANNVVRTKTKYEEISGNPVTITKRPAPGSRYVWILDSYNEYTKNGVTVPCHAPLVTGYVQVIKTPTPVISGETKMCEKSVRRVYTGRVTNAAEYDSLSWGVDKSRSWTYLNSKEKDPKGHSILVNWIQPGIDTLYLSAYYTRNGKTCYDSTSMVVKVAKNPEVKFSYTIPGAGVLVRFLNETTQDSVRDSRYDAATGKAVNVTFPVYNSYSWDFGRDSDTGWVTYPFLTDSIQRVVKDGDKKALKQKYSYGYHTVVLRATSDYGCSVKDSLEIFVDIQKAMYFPNVIVVPGNGNSTDVNKFLVKGFNLKSYKLSIYDQWGNLLFYTDKLTPDGRPLEGWDGTYQGQLMKEDVYMYKVEADFQDETSWDGAKFGNFMLLRNK